MVYLTVIYPAFNEQDNVKRIPIELIPHLKRLGKSYEVLIIDDGSTDNTAVEVRKLQKRYQGIRLVKHARNMGLGSAIRTGIRHAKGKLTVTIDGDFTFHPRQIKSLLARFEKGYVDCVIGSPTLKGYGKDVPLHRILLSKSANAIYDILLGQHITAVSPIFRLYVTRQLKQLRLNARGFDINAEILFKLLRAKRRVVEIPALLTTRKYGVSKLNNWKEIKNHLKLIRMIAMIRLGVQGESRNSGGDKT